MKKILALILTIAMAVALFTGCTGTTVVIGECTCPVDAHTEAPAATEAATEAPATPEAPAAEGAVKTGLAVSTNIADSIGISESECLRCFHSTINTTNFL